MSAAIFDMLTHRRETPSPETQAREQVTAQISERVTHTILAQARARAVRSVIGGRPVHIAVRSAVAWALSADHGDLPPAA